VDSFLGIFLYLVADIHYFRLFKAVTFFI